jgi:c-di-GMP-binding flagellar brake protein YcgR
VAVTCQINSEWKNLRSKALQRTSQGLWLEYPACGEDPAVEIGPGTKLGLSFKLKHHKHIFNAIVEEVGQAESPDGRPTRAIRLPIPYRVHRVQRRAYQRVDVPRNRSVLGTFWRGGLSAAAQANQLGLVWEAWLTNISAGGFQVRLSGRSAPDLEVGDLVGVRIDLGQDYRDVLVNAQFRQQHEDGRGVAYQGFQFIGLHESTRGREMLRRIAGIVCEFQRIEGRRHDNVA